MQVLEKPYPDESLYSILARFINTSYGGQYWTVKGILFGNKCASSSSVIPSSISNLSQFGIDYKKYVVMHTQYCFYTVFLSKDALDVVNAQIDGKGTGGDHFSTIGQIRLMRTFRFCPICAAEEYNKFGEMYWHRLHQTPGVCTCERHRIPLFETAIRNEPGNKNYIVADFNNIFPIEQISCQKSALSFYYQLTQDIKYIYENYEKIREAVLNNEECIRKAYLELCYRRGLATSTGSLHIYKLKSVFLNAIPKEILQMTGLSFLMSEKTPWLIKMCRSGKVTTNPLKHLLFSEFLCGSFRIFVEKHMLNNNTNVATTRRNSVASEDKKEIYRKKWLSACSINGNNYLSEVQKVVPSVYLWLTRNDKEWLQNNSKHKRKGGTITYHDWECIDKEFAKKIKDIATEIKQKTDYPERVTKTLLMRKIGRSPRNYLDSKLPETMKEIKNQAESNQEFRMRKLRIAFAECIRFGQKPTKWKVLRKASISEKYTEECWNQFLREMDDKQTICRKVI